MRIRGPILNPQPDGSVQFIADGALVGDTRGRIAYVGPASHIDTTDFHRSVGIICPPFFDSHIHIPQHPIRGRFMEGIGPNPPEGRLIAGLHRNVFPAEARCADPDYAREVVGGFLQDTLAHGVIGGAAYMTIHPAAARVALEMLAPTWSVGLVLMNINCPPQLRTNEATLERDIQELARDFGRRVIVTDRFAVAVDSRLRRRAVSIADRLGLRMQTHLNEQLAEKRFVEQTLYPDAGSYTQVYERDGLLDRQPILAHCVRMSDGEFERLATHRGVTIAHCPISNTLLGSGVMPLERVMEQNLDYAICTDVGASPTTSLLCEMAQFLKVHHAISHRATPGEALYRTTLAAARILELDQEFGSFELGKAMSFVQIDPLTPELHALSADEVIRSHLLEMHQWSATPQYSDAIRKLRETGLDSGPELHLLQRDIQDMVARLDKKVRQVVHYGRTIWKRN
ncbi:amidohydrolase family protein [Fontivita pretiosa]|uniref:amidohydrolase family protein n=1 Tax=Fontivita pretiosa TaxID=2989684 RepID=UPI003D16451D